MKKIKILYIHHGSGIGGAPISLLNLIRNLNNDRFEVKVCFLQDGEAEKLFQNNKIITDTVNGCLPYFAHLKSEKTHWIYFYRYFRIFWVWIRTANTIAPTYLKKQDFDILHLNSHALTAWAAAGKKMGKPVILHNREAISQGYFGLRRFILRRLISSTCDHVVNINNDNLKRLNLPKISSIVYNFVDIPSKFRQPMENKKTKKNILYLGGQSTIKGFNVVADSLKYLAPDIVIQFAGNYGNLEKNTSWLIKIKNLIKLNFYGNTYISLNKIINASNAEILGLLKNPYVAIDECDILITPFIFEHFSRPAMESFAYGKPVIGTNILGMEEIIDDGVNGILIEKNNSKSLAEAINYLCENPEIARTMGENARKKSESKFSPQKNVHLIESLYEKLLNNTD